MTDIGFTFASVFDRLERATPEQRKQLFHRIETRWCWDCGREQGDPAGHAECPSAPLQPRDQ